MCEGDAGILAPAARRWQQNTGVGEGFAGGRTGFGQSNSTRAWTADLAMSAGQYANTSRTCGRPVVYPVVPGKPLVTSGANSFVNRSTAALWESRTATRSTTSGGSVRGSTPGTQSPVPSASTWLCSNVTPA